MGTVAKSAAVMNWLKLHPLRFQETKSLLSVCARGIVALHIGAYLQFGQFGATTTKRPNVDIWKSLSIRAERNFPRVIALWKRAGLNQRLALISSAGQLAPKNFN